jgi:hypothetical protein
MAIFPILENEAVVQVNDKTRLDGSKSFVTQNQSAISKIEISPNGAASAYIVVTTDEYLDWQYSSSGTFAPKIRVTAGAASASAAFSSSISVVTSTLDYLFSTDQDLKLHEPDVLKYVQDGRATFKDVHRRAQTIIIKWLDKEGYIDAEAEPFTKADIIDIEEVKQWSTYVALRLIYEGISNSVDDIFAKKAEKYGKDEIVWRNRAILRLDEDGDGTAQDGEGVDPASGFAARR